MRVTGLQGLIECWKRVPWLNPSASLHSLQYSLNSLPIRLNVEGTDVSSCALDANASLWERKQESLCPDLLAATSEASKFNLISNLDWH
jgi:hypothetical protein